MGSWRECSAAVSDSIIPSTPLCFRRVYEPYRFSAPEVNCTRSFPTIFVCETLVVHRGYSILRLRLTRAYPITWLISSVTKLHFDRPHLAILLAGRRPANPANVRCRQGAWPRKGVALVRIACALGSAAGSTKGLHRVPERITSQDEYYR